ncbi:MAG: MltA-interacting MipA [Tardiphaga sp.]|nr:MltA-interacting MipA [Tardiphaga sp.]
MACSVAAYAQPVAVLPAPPVILPFIPSPVGGWTVTVGLGGEVEPSFAGANSVRFSPVPIFSLRRAGTPVRFRSMRDGASFAIFDPGNGFRAGPVGKYKHSRKSSDHAELTGLRDVDFAVELGGFAEYFAIDWLRLRAEVRRGFGGHEGVIADFSADVIVPLAERLTFAAGPRYTVTNAGYASTYFGVSAAESLASGLPVFDAGGGSHTVGAGAQLRYQLNPQWEVRSYVEFDRLLGAAADSPLVRLRGTPNQTTGGIGVAYSFDVEVR